MERRPFVQPALYPDPAAVHLDKLLGDAQAEPRAAKLARDGRVELLELREQRADLVVRNADAGVRYAVANIFAVAGGVDADAPSAGKFERVASQVQQALRDPLCVAVQYRREAVVGARLELEALFLGERAQRGAHGADHLAGGVF